MSHGMAGPGPEMPARSPSAGIASFGVFQGCLATDDSVRRCRIFRAEVSPADGGRRRRPKGAGREWTIWAMEGWIDWSGRVRPGARGTT